MKHTEPFTGECQSHDKRLFTQEFQPADKEMLTSFKTDHLMLEYDWQISVKSKYFGFDVIFFQRFLLGLMNVGNSLLGTFQNKDLKVDAACQTC